MDVCYWREAKENCLINREEVIYMGFITAVGKVLFWVAVLFVAAGIINGLIALGCWMAKAIEGRTKMLS
jgi:hypothetical protein